MASPKIEVVCFFDSTTGAPLAGLTPTFNIYKKDDGTDLSGSAPSISAVGGGAYKFTPTFADVTHGIVYIIDGGSTAIPRYAYRAMRAEDWNEDSIPSILTYSQRASRIEEGRWKIFTTGGDANRLVLYDSDGSTVLQKWDLKDSAGSATTSNIFERVPVNSVP